MGQVVADISKYAATENGRCDVPIPEKHGMCKFPERYSKDKEKSRWHDQSQLVHWQVVMNAVEKEV